jgi:hypothetical protein
MIGVAVLRETRWAPVGATPPRNCLAPPVNNAEVDLHEFSVYPPV